MKTWSDHIGALYGKMKTDRGRCSGYFLQQAEKDVRQQLQEVMQRRSALEEAAAGIFKILENNYDWLRWAVMVHSAVGPLDEDGGRSGGPLYSPITSCPCCLRHPALMWWPATVTCPARWIRAASTS